MARTPSEPIPHLTAEERSERVPVYTARLVEQYGEPAPALHFRNPYELLVAVILSAQTTDVGVNKVTPILFERYPDCESLAAADPDDVERIIKSTGFFRQKTKNIMASCRTIVAEHGGAVPDTMDELVALPGVARKTANIVLDHGFGKTEGIAVDTHVFRLAHRLGLSEQMDPNKVEIDLMREIPREMWHRVNYDLITHGRRVCTAKRPACGACFLNDVCPSAFVPAGWRQELPPQTPPEAGAS
jgi:endonuclease-3